MSTTDTLLRRILAVLLDIRNGINTGPVGSYRSQKIFGLEIGNEIGHVYTVDGNTADTVAEFIGGDGKNRVSDEQVEDVAQVVGANLEDWGDRVAFIEVDTRGLNPEVTFWEQA